MLKLTLIAAACLSTNAADREVANEPRRILVARVDHVVDGDSMVVVHDRNQISVRLEGIDAPESGQRFGEECKAALSKALPHATEVVMEVHGKDKYDRMLAIVHQRKLTAKSVSHYAVEQGYAWHFAKYNDSPELASAQKRARSRRKGLWRTTGKPMPPWDYRVQEDRGEVMDGKSVRKAPAGYYERPTATTHTHWVNPDGTRHKVTCLHADHARGRPCTASTGQSCEVCGE